MKHILVLTTLLFLMCLAVRPVSAQNVRGQVFHPPKAMPYGVSQAEWSARWWNWVVSVPNDRNPINDTTGEFCDEGQSGPVYFLSSVWLFPGGTFVRHCTIPSNRTIYVSIAGTFCSPITDGTTTPEETSECARTGVDGAMPLVHINGQEIDIQDHRFHFGPFDMNAPDGNVFEPWGIPPGGFLIEDAFSDVYGVMLPPLSVGQHTIHVYGEYSQFPGYFWDLTYNLTIVPAKGPVESYLNSYWTKPMP